MCYINMLHQCVASVPEGRREMYSRRTNDTPTFMLHNYSFHQMLQQTHLHKDCKYVGQYIQIHTFGDVPTESLTRDKAKMIGRLSRLAQNQLQFRRFLVDHSRWFRGSHQVVELCGFEVIQCYPQTCSWLLPACALAPSLAVHEHEVRFVR